MAITVGTRPASLDGCFSSWSEKDQDVVERTEYDSGNVRTRRRWTGRARMITAQVRLKTELYDDFMDWYRTMQRQGAIATTVKDPLGRDLVVQWVEPPQIQFGQPGSNVFTATVQMYRGAEFP